MIGNTFYRHVALLAVVTSVTGIASAAEVDISGGAPLGVVAGNHFIVGDLRFDVTGFSTPEIDANTITVTPFLTGNEAGFEIAGPWSVDAGQGIGNVLHSVTIDYTVTSAAGLITGTCLYQLNPSATLTADAEADASANTLASLEISDEFLFTNVSTAGANTPTNSWVFDAAGAGFDVSFLHQMLAFAGTPQFPFDDGLTAFAGVDGIRQTFKTAGLTGDDDDDGPTQPGGEVPEPASALLLGLAGAAMLARRRA